MKREASVQPIGHGRLFALAVLGLASTLAQGGTILGPATASTNMGSYSANYLPTFAINQSALTPGYISGVTDFATFTATANTFLAGGGGNNIWYSSQGVVTGNFDFDLGGTYTIDALALWNDPQNAKQGVKQFRLYAANNPSFTSPTLLGTYSAVEGLGNANLAQVFNFSSTTAAYVRMEILSNHGSTFVTGISEAAFDVAAVPVPAAFWLFGSALGIGGVLKRRIRR